MNQTVQQRSELEHWKKYLKIEQKVQNITSQQVCL